MPHAHTLVVQTGGAPVPDPRPTTSASTPLADASQYATMFAALGHPVRLQIVRLLLRAHPDGLVVGDIQAQVQVPGSTLTHHLDALRRPGIIEGEREGQWIRYRASVAGLRSLVSFLWTECCAETKVVPASAITPPPGA